jgi:3-deoxy-manno-octulosonate cytidylyltransferase (CMP-KDO synthetase)
MKMAAVIPARLSSTRFPRKLLLPITGIPMVEHVRRRALMCTSISEVFVATCDEELADVVRRYGGQVIMTSEKHINGTSRVAEAITAIDCTHVLLLQGDEPAFLPRHVADLICAATDSPQVDAWNVVAALGSEDELDKSSFVKCAINPKNKILYCFRRTPHFSNFNIQRKFVRKLLGMIAYRKDFLLELNNLPVSLIEDSESIEQMRIIESGHDFRCIEVTPSLPSINEPEEVQIVLDLLAEEKEQQVLLRAVMEA